MTFLASRNKIAQMEVELRMWWQLSYQGHTLARTAPQHPDLADIRDEVEVLAHMTDWPRLRTVMLSCAALVVAVPMEASAAMLLAT